MFIIFGDDSSLREELLDGWRVRGLLLDLPLREVGFQAFYHLAPLILTTNYLGGKLKIGWCTMVQKTKDDDDRKATSIY